ncbi:hypothetical protein [Chitinophaga sp.]|uniref:hypothetical protein n=1 Tax=Chitinophaga sp. TaxID=1869181 RepID=UPI002630E95D|nr:hypothetical protein [uncultured Chitinophaga sp.]
MSKLMLMTLLGTLLGSASLFGQDSSSAGTQLSEDVVLRLFGRTREVVFTELLRVGRSEQPEFLETFYAYTEEKMPVAQMRALLLRTYNEKFQALDEPMLQNLTKNILKNDREYVDLQTRYYRRMIKVIGATRAAMFFQLDNYLDQSERLFLQTGLPFIRELETGRRIAATRLQPPGH